MSLTDVQQRLVEQNMGLVGDVIARHVHNPNGMGVYSYDDLFQIGCVGLCKAATKFKLQGKPFTSYAYVIIRNEIYDALTAASKQRGHEISLEESSEVLDSYAAEAKEQDCDVYGLLESSKLNMKGVCAKGIEALQLKAQGYTSAEIGEMYGVSANNVTAWIARARARLRQDSAFMARLEMGA